MNEGGRDIEPEAARQGEQGTALSRRRFNRWLWRVPVLAAIGSSIWGFRSAYRVHFQKGVPPANPVFTPAEPQRVTNLSELANPWDATEFVFASATGRVPAIALRVPQPIPGGLSTDSGHYIAFSQICTHLGCVSTLNRDLEAIAFAFNFRTDAPALVCRCHLSVFDPTRAGRAVSGPAVEPLPRVQLRLEGEDLYAVGLEQTEA